MFFARDILYKFYSCSCMLSLTRARARAHKIYDNNFYIIWFAHKHICRDTLYHNQRSLQTMYANNRLYISQLSSSCNQLRERYITPQFRAKVKIDPTDASACSLAHFSSSLSAKCFSRVWKPSDRRRWWRDEVVDVLRSRDDRQGATRGEKPRIPRGELSQSLNG